MEPMPHQKNVSRRATSDTVDRLLWSALSVFSEKGYEGASIREIIQRANVTRPVLYYHFKNKEELFYRLLDHVTELGALQRDQAVSPVSGCRQRLKALIRTEFEHAEQAPEVVRFVLQTFFSPLREGPELDRDRLWRGRFQQILKIIEEGLETGELEQGDPRALALAFSGMMDMHIMGKSHQPQARLTPDLGEALVDLFLDGARAASPTREALKTPFVFGKSETGGPASFATCAAHEDGEEA